MKKELITKSPEETYSFAEKLGARAKKGDIFALMGDLGTGKTIVAKGIARGLGINDDITSPTFTLMEVYEGSLTLYHFDLYRIEKNSEFDYLFFEEYWEDDGVSVIEWADRALDRLPGGIITLHIQYIDETSRRIVIEYPDS
jgi:tRNA threonylcarbamoyladenosine biosynthesis protein TsaE